MLPASSSPAHTALAGSPFLCACAADGDNFVRISRTLRSRSVRAIARFGSWGSLRIRARLYGVCCLHCRSRQGGELSALDDERRWRVAPRPACRQAQTEERRPSDYGQEQLPPAKSPCTARTEATAVPETPASACDALATFSTKIGFVHGECSLAKKDARVALVLRSTCTKQYFDGDRRE